MLLSLTCTSETVESFVFNLLLIPDICFLGTKTKKTSFTGCFQKGVTLAKWQLCDILRTKSHLLPTDSCLSVVRLKWWFVPHINLKNRTKHIFLTTSETSETPLHCSSWYLKFSAYRVDEIRKGFFSLTNELCEASHLANLSKKNKTGEVRNKRIFCCDETYSLNNYYGFGVSEQYYRPSVKSAATSPDRLPLRKVGTPHFPTVYSSCRQCMNVLCILQGHSFSFQQEASGCPRRSKL